LLRVAQLSGAGLNVRDTLPLVPVQQLLTNGIAATLASFTAAGVLLPLAVASYGDIRRHQALDTLGGELTTVETMIGRVESDIRAAKSEVEPGLAAIKADIARVEERITAGEPEESPEIQAEMKRLFARAEKLEQRFAPVGSAVDELTPVVSRLGRRTSQLLDTWRRPVVGLYTLAATIGLLFAPVAYGVGGAVAGLATVLIVRFSPQRFLLTRATLASSAITLLTAVVGAFVYPAPLPSVHLRTDHPTPVVVGGLVVVGDGRWLVANAKHEIVAIPEAHVQSATVAPRTRPRARSIFQLVFD
jgi:hypothetical protein